MALRDQIKEAAAGLREVVDLSHELQTIDEQLQARGGGDDARDLLDAIRSLRGGVVTIRTQAPNQPSAGEEAIVETLRRGFEELRTGSGGGGGTAQAETFSRGGF